MEAGVAPSGALIAAGSIVIRTPGDLVNSASLAGDRIDAQHGQTVSVTAKATVIKP